MKSVLFLYKTCVSIHPGGGVFFFNRKSTCFYTSGWGRDFYGFPVDVLWGSYGFPNKQIIFVEILDYLQLCSCATTNGDVLFLS